MITECTAADIMFMALSSDIDDQAYSRQQKAFDLVLRLINENVSLADLSDEEVEELAFRLPTAVQDYCTERSLPSKLVDRVRKLPCSRRHLI